MLHDSLAPLKRAGLFFSFMGVAIVALTFGAGLQAPGDRSSTTVEQAKLERQGAIDPRFASVDPGQSGEGAAKRAIPHARQAMLEADAPIVMR